MTAKKKLTLLVTDRATGNEERLSGETQIARLKLLRKDLGMSADVLRIRLLETLIPNSPPIKSAGYLYRMEEPE